MDTHICMAESLCCPPEITTPLSAIIQYKLKKLKKKKRWRLPVSTGLFSVKSTSLPNNQKGLRDSSSTEIEGGGKKRILKSGNGVEGWSLVQGHSIRPPQGPSAGRVVATDLIGICVDSRRLSRWRLMLDCSNRPVRHQDELGG